MKTTHKYPIFFLFCALILINCTKENIAPVGDFSVYPRRGDTTTIFSFDASLSLDAEESFVGLYVRWDWESDGIWDTHFTREKTINHMFETSGYKNVTMEVKDKAENISSISKEIIVGKNLSSTITDLRDKQIYRIVKIGDQWWFAENLNIGINIDTNKIQMDNGIIEKYCHTNIPANCKKSGAVYLWGEMINYTRYTAIQKLQPTDIIVKGICPDGWHIPSLNEWQTMLEYLPRDTDQILEGGLYGIDFTRNSWELFSRSENAPKWTYRNSSFWSSSMINNFHYSVEPVIEGYWWANYGNNAMAVRCIKDIEPDIIF
ncbi:FISUMP domain-containing protein [Bacteroidota bacterium]